MNPTASLILKLTAILGLGVLTIWALANGFGGFGDGF